MKKIVSKIKYIKIEYIIGIIPFILLLIPSIFYKLILKITNKQVWLICEQKNSARDNGYWFYKYMCENHKEIKCIYAIKKNCKDYERVLKIGKVTNWGSIMHYFYYMSSTKNISSHKDGNPNELIFTICHLYLNLFNNRVFLQHGITKDNVPMFYYKNTKFKLMICGAKKEYEYIRKNFGYSKENVVYTGFARFDSLQKEVNLKNQIVIIPTWRNWLGRETNFMGEKVDFQLTNYYLSWNELLNNQELINFLEMNNIDLIFYPHIHMQKYLNYFKSKSKNIKILGVNDINIQDLIKESKMLITDYSSVYFDFAYLEKPTIYYQFDYEQYRQKQLQEGYFNYNKNSFGPVLKSSKDVVKNIIDIYDNNFRIYKKYLDRVYKFFPLRDNNNCDRIYQCIVKRGCNDGK